MLVHNFHYLGHEYNRRNTARPLNGLFAPQDIQKRIAEKTISHFLKNDNKTVYKWKLHQYLEHLGFNCYDIRTTIENLIRDGILYEPKRDMVRLVDSKWLS